MKSIISKEDIKKTVTIRSGQAVTRSDKLAKMFDKQHKDILRKIRKLLADFYANNINPKTYFIEEKVKLQGGETTRYWLTRKGFDFVALSLTGKKALIYKAWYIDTFHEQAEIISEHKLTAKVHKADDKWLVFREEGKQVRKALTQTIKDTIIKYRYEVENKNDGKYYYHFTKLIYDVLGIELPKGAEPRDVLDERDLFRLEEMEKRVIRLIKKYHEQGIHYKEYFKLIKKDLYEH